MPNLNNLGIGGIIFLIGAIIYVINLILAWPKRAPSRLMALG